MRCVHVSDSHAATVDDGDYELVVGHKWRLRSGGKNVYAVTRIDGKEVFMHRLIMNAQPCHHIVDHVDGNGLNNCRANLRFCTRAENLRNSRWRATKGRTSRYKGVWRIKKSCRRCWRAGITANRIYKNIGSFYGEEEAARAYDAAAREKHGAFARPNFPDPQRGESVVPTPLPVTPEQPKKDEPGSAPNTRPRSRRPRCGKCRRPRRR
jgi:hypothetical protein